MNSSRQRVLSIIVEGKLRFILILFNRSHRRRINDLQILYKRDLFYNSVLFFFLFVGFRNKISILKKYL